MRVQKALIEDEISEKKAGLLLYSLQMSASNLKNTTFTDSKKQVVTEMPVSPTASGSQTPTSRVIGKTLPLMNADQKRLPKSSESKTKTKTFTTEDTEKHRGKGQPQPGAAVPHEHRVGSGV
jgi:hypothetical protein